MYKCNGCNVYRDNFTDFRKCGRCGIAIYCNADCQVRDWSQHKTVCAPPQPKPVPSPPVGSSANQLAVDALETTIRDHLNVAAKDMVRSLPGILREDTAVLCIEYVGDPDVVPSKVEPMVSMAIWHAYVNCVSGKVNPKNKASIVEARSGQDAAAKVWGSDALGMATRSFIMTQDVMKQVVPSHDRLIHRGVGPVVFVLVSACVRGSEPCDTYSICLNITLNE